RRRRDRVARSADFAVALTPSPAPSHGVADGAGRRRFSSPLMVEVLAARRDGDAEDFHIARASPSIRAVSRMDVLLPAIIGQRARRRMRYPHSAKEDLRMILKKWCLLLLDWMLGS
ncbi:hypothetical protein, partial [uncultured Adlercreutzia sp.]|uniref:hypothetical protein n=1 Tax=uncultured Adlercreutzia sp. TaxID=875803 RepID=UPI00265D0924